MATIARDAGLTVETLENKKNGRTRGEMNSCVSGALRRLEDAL